MGESKSPYDENVHKRFWDKVKIGSKTDCWEWIAHRNKDGYGRLRINNKDYTAHRVSWEIHNGPLPKWTGFDNGLCIMHKCDNPSCVNPNHLSAGTNIENQRDSSAKGRSQPSKLKRRTHCKWGHEFTPENTYFVLGTKRRCRICSATTARRFRERREMEQNGK